MMAGTNKTTETTRTTGTSASSGTTGTLESTTGTDTTGAIITSTSAAIIRDQLVLQAQLRAVLVTVH
jgi:hypothetical protein